MLIMTISYNNIKCTYMLICLNSYNLNRAVQLRKQTLSCRRRPGADFYPTVPSRTTPEASLILPRTSGSRLHPAADFRNGAVTQHLGFLFRFEVFLVSCCLLLFFPCGQHRERCETTSLPRSIPQRCSFVGWGGGYC